LLSGVVDVAAGAAFSLASKSDGSVWAWGANSSGQLGDATTSERLFPVRVSGLPAVVDIAAGGTHGMALSGDGTVWTWGANQAGQLGDGTTEDRLVPVQVKDASDPSGFLTDVTAIAGGGAHSLALKTDGTVRGWGSAAVGAVGDGSRATEPLAIRVAFE
jgi:alpha-tubulin suppressor-like RCC1 family protein